MIRGGRKIIEIRAFSDHMDYEQRLKESSYSKEMEKNENFVGKKDGNIFFDC